MGSPLLLVRKVGQYGTIRTIVSDPIFSPDGSWMWTGNEWIPAPPDTPSEKIDVSVTETEVSVIQEFNVDSVIEQINDLEEETLEIVDDKNTVESEVPTITIFSMEYTQSFYLVCWSIGMILIALALGWFDGIIWNIILLLGAYEIIECLIVTTKFQKKNKLAQYSLSWKVHIFTTISLWLVIYLMIDIISSLDNPNEYGIGGDRAIGAGLWLMAVIFCFYLTVLPIANMLDRNPKVLDEIKNFFGVIVGVMGGMVQLSQGQMPQINSNSQTQRLIQTCHGCNKKMKIMYRFSKCGRVLCNSCSGGFTCKYCSVGCVATQIN